MSLLFKGTCMNNFSFWCKFEAYQRRGSFCLVGFIIDTTI